MKNEPIFLNQFNITCLSHYSYYLESNKEAAIVDPMTDIQPYLQQQSTNKSKIKYVLNTHTQTDYIMGCFDLGIKTGATIVFSNEASFFVNGRFVNKELYEKKTENKKEDEQDLSDFLYDFGVNLLFLGDNQTISLGLIQIKTIHTPGHTLDSCCYVVVDGNGKTSSVFSGDTILVGDIGKPDMSLVAERRENVFQVDLGKMLYKSIRNLIKLIPEDVTIYPTHFHGAPIAKNIKEGNLTTIKQELATNKYFADIPEYEFLDLLASDNTSCPEYFSHIARQNLNYKTGKNFEYNLMMQLNSLSASEVMEKVDAGAVLIDSRHCFSDMEEGFITNSYLISLKTSFSILCGRLLNPDDEFIIIADEGKERDILSRLLRIGFKNVHGYLQGGFKSYLAYYKENPDKVKAPSKFEFVKEKTNTDFVFDSEIIIVDVREKNEYSTSLPNSIICPLSEFADAKNFSSEVQRLKNTEKNMYLLCKHGVRSTVAFSILSKWGYKNIKVLEGGITKIKEKGVKI